MHVEYVRSFSVEVSRAASSNEHILSQPAATKPVALHDTLSTIELQTSRRMVHAKHPRSQRKKRRWMEFTESQLVLATLANGKTTNTTRTSTRTRKEVVETTLGKDEPALITPSPSSNRHKTRQISARSKRKHATQLFRRSMISKHTIETEEQDATAIGTPRRLFDNITRTTRDSISSRQVPCSPEPHMSDECMLQEADPPQQLPQLDHPTPKRSNRSQRTVFRSKRVSTSWDSLASMSSVATKVSLMTTTTENGTTTTRKTMTHSEESSHDSVPTGAVSQDFAPTASLSRGPRSSLIPPNLLTVLAPIGLSRKLRTRSQILEEAAQAAKSAIPIRQKLPRACKDDVECQRYIEESDEEAIFPPQLNLDDSVGCGEKKAIQNTPSRPAPTTSLPKIASPSSSTTQKRKQSTKESPARASQTFFRRGRVGQTKRHLDNQLLQSPATIRVQRSSNRKASRREPSAFEAPVEQESRTPSRQRRHRHEQVKGDLLSPRTRSSSSRPKKKGTSYKELRCAAMSPGNSESSVISKGARKSPPKSRDSGRHTHNASMDSETRTALTPERRRGHENAVGGMGSPPRKQRDLEKRQTDHVKPSRESRIASLVHQSRKSEAPSITHNEQLVGLDVVPHIQPVVQVTSESSRRKKHSKKKKSKKKKSKVRFAPLPTATTTFSVKIRVKTSLNPGRSSSNNGQLISQAPALSESTVQSIANQITQACLLQAQNNNSTPSNHLLENVSPMQQPAIQAIKNGARSRGVDETQEKPFEVAVDCDTSVISDLTRERTKVQSYNVPNEGDAESDTDPFQHGATLPDNSDSDSVEAESALPAQVIPLPSRQSAPSQPAFRGRRVRANDDHSFASSNKRRRRFFSSTDSLAGSLADFSQASTEMAAPVVPKEVAIKSASSQSNRSPADRNASGASNSLRRVRRRSGLPYIDETVATDPSHIGGCGKCSGCRRTFDCMNCDNCLNRLQSGEFEGAKKSDCLGRICQVVKSYSYLDSLGMADRPAAPHPVDKSLQQEDDFSYLSEVEWKNQKPKQPRKRLSRAARLWGHPISLRKGSSTAGSISSVTTMTGIGGTVPATTALVAATKKTGGRSKGKKKKSHLHYMEMPMSTDGSVASWMEGRRSLRALMQYDEADQDWM